MQDNNEEVKGCCGGKCSNPRPEPEKCDGPCQTCTEETCSCKSESSSLVVAPEGLEVNLDVGTDDLKERLDKLFSLAKLKTEAAEQEAKEKIITGQTGIDTSDFVTVELPNGMTVQVHKDSHKSKQEDMHRLIAAAGGEMDCADEDDEGNKINHEVEYAPDGTDKAQTEYRPGMLRDLKSKFYANDNSGEEAQARLDSRVADVETEVATRSQFRQLGTAHRIRKTGDDIITISPIANPSLVRRLIRTVRRTMKRLVTWWRL